MAPWYLRRLKADVLKDLPDKYYTRIWVDLSPKQRKAYDEMARVMVAWLEEKGYTDDTALARPMVAQVIIAQLQRLQQFALGYMEHAGTKLVWVVNKQTGEREQVEKDIWRMVDPSAKLDAMMELLEDMDDGQVVIWSQFKGAITLLAKRLEAKGISFGLLTGDTPQADRGPLVADFQAGRIRVIAGTIATGGVGITLTAASTVVFLDRAWSPALNTQAEDRLHRIGQENAVQVIDLMARSTVDLGRHQQLETKMSWLRAILGDK
jgi:SNF2 family DNA or RNA helicase